MGSLSIQLLPLIVLLGLTLTLVPLSAAQDSPQDFVDAHNAARAQVGVGPIAWNDTVAAYAQDYASSHIEDCQLVHSGTNQYGENLAGSTGDLSGVEAVNLWVQEGQYYDYDTNSCSAGEYGCLHYTQVVWRDSVLLGCAKVTCSSGGTFIGCNYFPPGNIIGQKPY